MLGDFSYHIRYATEAIRPFLSLPAHVQADPEIVRNHRRVIRWGAATGIANSCAWAVMLLIPLLRDGLLKGDWWDFKTILLVPVLPIVLFLPGTFVGVCFALAVAPARFLNGPGGQRWTRLIGTRNRTAGRVICVIGGLGSSPMILFPMVAIVGILFLA